MQNRSKVKLVKPMYPCQDVPVVVFSNRCNKPCLYCDLYQKEFTKDEIITVGIENVIQKAAEFKGAYFSAITDCFLKNNQKVTHNIIEKIWVINERFVPLIVTKQTIPEETCELIIKNKHRLVLQISIPSVNERLVSILEPGSASVAERIKMISRLTKAGVPVIAVVMPWFDVYEENESIEDLPKTLADAGIKRCIIGTGVLPNKQREKILATNNTLMVKAVKKMTQTELVTTKTGDTLPIEERIFAFKKLIGAFNKNNIKARVCTADNPDLMHVNKNLLCFQFKHKLLKTIN